MKTTRLLWLLVIVTMLASTTFVVRADDAAEHDALRVIKTAYEDAVNKGDPSKLAAYLSTNVTGVMVTGDAVQGFQGLQAYWNKIQKTIGPGGSYHVTVKVDESNLYGDLAVSSGSTDDRLKLANGKEFEFNSLWTSVCQKQGGVWKVIRMQATMNPIDNVFVASSRQLTKLIYGAGGFLAGGVLVWVIYFSRRKRM